MKVRSLVALGALMMAVASVYAQSKQGQSHAHGPRHGGIVAEHKDVDLELLAKPDLIQVHARDHDGKPRDVSKASGKLTLLSGKEKQEVELKPAGSVLEAKGVFKVDKGTRAVVVVRGVAKSDVTGRFTVK